MRGLIGGGKLRIDRGEPRHGLALAFHGLEKYVTGARPDEAVSGFVYDHDDIGIGFESRLANNFVDAALVVTIFHLLFNR